MPRILEFETLQHYFHHDQRGLLVADVSLGSSINASFFPLTGGDGELGAEAHRDLPSAGG